MSDTLHLSIEGLSSLSDGLKDVQREMPDVLFRQLRRAGNAFKREYQSTMSARTKKHTGRLIKGARATMEVQRGSMNRFESQIRGGSKKTKAPHFWLVENGHRGFVPDRSGVLHYIGEVEGKHAMDDTRKDWSGHGKLIPYAQKALEEAIRKGLKV